VGNGRIEATEIDIATKTAGRIKDILINDGDIVEAGQIVARMDTQTLEAELRQAQAQVRQAQQAKATATAIVAQRESAKSTAAAVVAQRESAKVTAAAVVTQRESELALAEKELTRSQQLAFKGAGSQQQLDTDYTRYKSTTAALSAAHSQLLETQSAIAAAKSQAAEAQSHEVAKSQVVEAQSAIERLLPRPERLKVEIEDGIPGPRSGRVQYRVAQPGEVLPAGGRYSLSSISVMSI
jgi:HlyD family secretion protein